MPFEPQHHAEMRRLEELHRYHILDTLPEPEFDDYTRLAAQICEAPTAVISLVDADRLWFKSRHGMALSPAPRDQSFCGHAIHGEGVLEVADAAADQRFADNPAVAGSPHLRFYAGAPLVTAQGQSLGTLCVFDTTPRALRPDQRTALEILARQVVRQMDTRLQISRERELNVALSSQSRFQKVLLESAMVAVMSITGRGVVSGFNPAAEGLLGWSEEEVLGKKTIADFHLPEELQARAAELSSQLGCSVSAQEALLVQPRKGVPETREWTYRCKSGQVVPVRVSVAALVEDDEVAAEGFVVLAWDITERRQAIEKVAQLNAELEAQVLQRTLDLQQTTSDLQALSYSLAHDLRQPLISIGGYSSLLQQHVSSDKAHRLLERISFSIRQIDVRANALLYFANLSLAPLQRKTVDLTQAAESYLQVLQAKSPQRVVACIIQPDLQGFGDANLLAKVIKELLENAWQSTASCPLTTIEVGSEIGEEGNLCYFVRDNGVGFDMTYANSLFEPFQSLQGQVANGGDGLGLARVKRILLKHGGKVWADSQPGKGSTFYFTVSAP